MKDGFISASEGEKGECAIDFKGYSTKHNCRKGSDP